MQHSGDFHDNFVQVGDLVQVFLTLLHNLEDAQADEVAPPEIAREYPQAQAQSAVLTKSTIAFLIRHKFDQCILIIKNKCF